MAANSSSVIQECQMQESQVQQVQAPSLAAAPSLKQRVGQYWAAAKRVAAPTSQQARSAPLPPPLAHRRSAPPGGPQPRANGYPVQQRHHSLQESPLSFRDDDPVENPQSIVAQQPEPDLSSGSDGPLSLTTRVEYSALPQGQTQDVFGLITVQASAAPPAVAGESERQPTDIVCVLDVSGSMSCNNKIEDLRKAVKFIIEQSSPQDRLSIVTFNNSAARVLRMRNMTSDGKNDALCAAMRLTAGGGTSITSGLTMGLDILEQRRQRHKVSAILLLTDGQDRSAASNMPRLIARARAEGSALYAFGFGSDHDAKLLSEVAEHAQTPFTYVEDTENLTEIFAGALGGLTSVVAQNVELILTCHVPLKHLHTPFATQRDPDGRRVTVKIPDVFAGERRDFVVELQVPAGGSSGPETLLESSLRYTNLSNDCVVQTPTAIMEATRVEEPQPELEPDEEVSAQRERVEIMEALQVATNHGDGGDFGQAQSVLEAAEQRQASKKKTRMTDALSCELADAKSRLVSRSAWEGGGRAEVKDAWQMHNVQRCTNVAQSSKSRMKCSKQMYISSAQESMMAKLGGNS